MEKILADLAARYPEGYVCFTNGGKRLAEVNLYQRKTGYSVNINGVWLFYSRLGVLIHAATMSGGFLGRPQAPPRKDPVPVSSQQHSSRGPVAAARLARGIARIEGRA